MTETTLTLTEIKDRINQVNEDILTAIIREDKTERQALEVDRDQLEIQFEKLASADTYRKAKADLVSLLELVAEKLADDVELTPEQITFRHVAQLDGAFERVAAVAAELDILT
jgi:hypothetical protein